MILSLLDCIPPQKASESESDMFCCTAAWRLSRQLVRMGLSPLEALAQAASWQAGNWYKSNLDQEGQELLDLAQHGMQP